MLQFGREVDTAQQMVFQHWGSNCSKLLTFFQQVWKMTRRAVPTGGVSDFDRDLSNKSDTWVLPAAWESSYKKQKK